MKMVVTKKKITNRRKIIVVIYTVDNWDQPKVILSPGVQRSFEVWRNILRAKGYELGRASIHWFNGRHFIHYWLMHEDNTWEKVNKPLWPTFIYDKTRSYDFRTGQLITDIREIKRAISEKFFMLNAFEFTNLIGSKLNQAILFHDFMPVTRLYLPGTQIENPNRENIVLKRLYGSGGQQVKITRNPIIHVREMMVRQKFVNATKRGQLRDIRLAFIGDEPQYAYYRIAKKGDLFTNVHRGASMKFEKLHKLSWLIEFSKRVAAPLQVFRKKIFSLDYLIDSKTNHPFLIEANSMPGFENFPDTVLEEFFSSLTNLFLSK